MSGGVRGEFWCTCHRPVVPLPLDAVPANHDDDGDDDDDADDAVGDNYEGCSFALISSGKRLSQNFISIRLTLINDCFNSHTHTH